MNKQEKPKDTGPEEASNPMIKHLSKTESKSSPEKKASDKTENPEKNKFL
jgi:hypothetical protein